MLKLLRRAGAAHCASAVCYGNLVCLSVCPSVRPSLSGFLSKGFVRFFHHQLADSVVDLLDQSKHAMHAVWPGGNGIGRINEVIGLHSSAEPE